MTLNPFSILRTGEPTISEPKEPDAAAMATAREYVGRLVGSADVLIFMKGSRQAPMCGYSANTISVVSSYGVPFETFDVLGDPDIRAAAKEFAEWPTFPQLYVLGEFIGGDDIITEMHNSGELGQLLRGRSS